MIKNLNKISKLLSRNYNDFDHHNLKNPLWELVFIICSVKTTERNYRSTYKNLRRKFPRLNDLSSAPQRTIAKAIKEGGLSNQKAKSLKLLLSKVVEDFGSPSLSSLKKVSDKECEKYLTSLPGVGKKVARCVMLYSINRKVFPVDTHCWRISNRLGIIRKKNKSVITNKDMDRLQKNIPEGLRFSLHVNMVSLGREYCTPHAPNCLGCPITKLCPKTGVLKKIK